MRECSWRPVAGLALLVLFGACTNGGKNLRDTTGMTPGSAAGQVGTGASTGVAPAALPPGTTTGAAADSITSRRDTLGGRMKGMVPRARRDTTRRP